MDHVHCWHREIDRVSRAIYFLLPCILHKAVHRERQTDRDKERNTDRLTVRHTDRQADRQRETGRGRMCEQTKFQLSKHFYR